MPVYVLKYAVKVYCCKYWVEMRIHLIYQIRTAHLKHCLVQPRKTLQGMWRLPYTTILHQTNRSTYFWWRILVWNIMQRPRINSQGNTNTAQSFGFQNVNGRHMLVRDMRSMSDKLPAKQRDLYSASVNMLTKLVTLPQFLCTLMLVHFSLCYFFVCIACDECRWQG